MIPGSWFLVDLFGNFFYVLPLTPVVVFEKPRLAVR